ncbi:MAG: glutamate mutase L [Acholeplasmataceae bacterium]
MIILCLKLIRLNILPARQKIEEIFLNQIIEAKGITRFLEKIDNDIIPTPKSVLNAAELLSKGYFEEPGLKELVVIDIGGATTDIYSMCNPIIKHGVIFQGMEEDYAKRTVEANVGMRHSAPGAVESAPAQIVKRMEEQYNVNLTKEAKWRMNNYEWIPTSPNDIFIDQLIASLCVEYAISRHSGTIREMYSPVGTNYIQTGKDLSDVLYVIGTGGVIVNSKEPIAILNHSVSRDNNLDELRPINPEYLLDKDYIFSSMGLLMIERPVQALQIMKKRMVKLVGGRNA